MVEKDIRTHGSCLCRAVAYAVAGRPGPMWHCHCPICRKLSGAHGYVVAQAPWHTITDTLPRFATAPPSVVACPSPPIQHQTCPWQTAWAHGSCLCGGVAYEVSGTLEVIKNCHCWRDRKMTGAPHDSCLLAAASAVHWLQGEGLVVVYSLPEAPGFRTGITSSVEQKRRGSRLLTTCHSLPSILPQDSIGGKVASWSEGGSLPKNVNGDARRN
jgi:hypothetical protein